MSVFFWRTEILDNIGLVDALNKRLCWKVVIEAVCVLGAFFPRGDGAWLIDITMQ